MLLKKKIQTQLLLLIAFVAMLGSCGVRKQSSSLGQATQKQQNIIDYSMKYINTPYRYAGRTPRGFDCSGFTSFVFKEFGYRLNSSSSGQAKQFPAINNKRELRTGDLVFFEGRAHNRRVGHVGIVKDVLAGGEFTFIHSSTSNGVIISRSTEPYYASRYLRGGRVLKENNQVVLANQAQQDYPIHAKKAAPERKNIAANTVVEHPASKREQSQLSAVVPNGKANNRASETVVVHSRPLSTPVNKQQNKSNSDVPQTSKELREGNETSVPRPVEDKKYHTVQPSETLYSIARLYQRTVAQLQQWNPDLGSVLQAGFKLRVSP